MMLQARGYYFGSKMWRHRRAQKEKLDSIKEAKDFDYVRHRTQKHENEAHRKQKQVENSKYCATQHPRDSAYKQQDLENVGRLIISRHCAG